MDKTGRERRREGGQAECLPAVSLCFSVCSAGKQERGRLVQRTVKELYCGLRKKYRQQKSSIAFEIVSTHFLILYS